VQRGTIILRQESAFDLPDPSRLADAAELLHRASDLYEGIGVMEQHISALATYGMALSLQGKKAEALTIVGTAIRLAEEHRFPNVQVYALYQRGEINYDLGDYVQAQLDLARASALMEEKEIDEYGLPVYAVLGKVYEAQALTQNARDAYERALVEAKGKQEQELIRMAQRAEINLANLKLETASGTSYGGFALALAVLIGLAIGASFRFNFRHVSRPLVIEHAYSYLEPHLISPVPRSEPPSLFDRRVSYIYTVLDNPESVLPYVDDPFLIERIEKNDIQRRSILYALAAALETEQEGTTFDNDPANTFGTYLRKWFKKYDLTYPADIHGWRLYFSSPSEQNPSA
jgi:tetratricopeptide (TPR) repeat protein